MKIINLSKAFKLFIKRWELSWRFKFAHHPICTNYREHFWEIRGLYICQGCSLVYTSFVSGLLFLIVFHVVLFPLQYLFVGMGVLIPILMIEQLKIEQRIIKRLSRAGIGLGLSFSFSAFLLHPEIVLKVIGLIITICGFLIFKQVRKTAKRKDLCHSCPEYESNTLCQGLQLEADAMRKYSDYASNFLQLDLKEKYLKKLQ